MKMQMTLVATAISLALSSVAFAQQTPTDITTNTNLSGVDWGVDNTDTSEDDGAWNAGAPPAPTFSEAQSEMQGLEGGSQSTASGENLSRVDQEGNWNQASVSQGVNGRNESVVSQIGAQLDADVVQTGQRNYSNVDQNLADGGIANVIQTGDRNDSLVRQYGGEDNKTDVSQTGSDNDSVIHQGGISGGADLNQAWVNQSGNNNQSYIGQTWGDNNYADVSQAGDYGTSYVLQRGDNNMAFLDQQIGSTANESYILQDNRDSLGNGGNYAEASQGGSANISTVTQVGAIAGTAYVTQAGTGNEASTIQY